MAEDLIAGEDYYEERGLFVFTARYHLKRSYCCGSGCRHCPYDQDGRVRPEFAQDTPGTPTDSRHTDRAPRFGRS
jgi:hypothetical protein